MVKTTAAYIDNKRHYTELTRPPRFAEWLSKVG